MTPPRAPDPAEGLAGGCAGTRPGPENPTDLTAQTQHIALLPGDGSETGVLGLRAAMGLRDHGSGPRTTSHRLPLRSPKRGPAAGSRLLHLEPEATRASSPPGLPVARAWAAPEADTSCLSPVSPQLRPLAPCGLLGFSRSCFRPLRGQGPKLSRPLGEPSCVPWEDASRRSLPGHLCILGFSLANH